MNIRIYIPKNYEVENVKYIESSLQEIQTQDSLCRYNGKLVPLVNTLVPGSIPIQLVYITYCATRSVKGPHMHIPPKYDRFVCIEGSCVVVTRNEETQEYNEYHMINKDDYLLIPPYNSHAIVSKEGCRILNMCSEGYYPGYYNQIETEYKGYDWNQWLK